jgi:hypothetical protein
MRRYRVSISKAMILERSIFTPYVTRQEAIKILGLSRATLCRREHESRPGKVRLTPLHLTPNQVFYPATEVVALAREIAL